MEYYVLAAERKDSKGRYLVYFERQSDRGMVMNTNSVDYAKKFHSENEAKYYVYNAGQNMIDQKYQILPVVGFNNKHL
jgi:hypothetical protein